MSKFKLLALLLFSISTVAGTDYYYNQTGGNDANDCSTPALSCKTIVDLNTKSLVAGDNVYFARNEIWHFGDDAFPTLRSGNSTANVTYQAYGTGNKPILTGSKNLSYTANWSNATTGNPNIWNATFSIATEIGAMNYNGNIEGMTNSVLSGMTTQGEFYYNPPTGRVAIYSVGNPATYYSSIEAGLDTTIFDINSKSYIVIKDLDFRYGAKHAVEGQTNHHIYVINNSFTYIGGAYQTGTVRYGNAVQFYNNANNNLVDGNYFQFIYDTPMSNQGSSGSQSNIIYRNNVVTRSEYGYEAFLDGGGTMKNITVDHNTFYNIGENAYGRGSSYPVAIKGFRAYVGSTLNISNNIVYNSTYFSIDLGGSTALKWNGTQWADYDWYLKGSGTNMFYWGSGSNYATLALFQAGKANETHGVQSTNTTIFYNITGNDFRPVTGHPVCTMSSTGSYVGALPCYTEEEEEEPVINYNQSVPYFTDFEPGVNLSIWQVGSNFIGNCTGAAGAPTHFQNWTNETTAAGYYHSATTTMRTLDADAFATYWLQTPYFALNGSEATASFWMRARSENHYDGLELQYIINNTPPWKAVNLTTPYVNFTTAPFATDDGYNNYGTSGTVCKTGLFGDDTGLIMVNLTVKDTSGNLSIRFVGISDTNTDYADPDGFWLDDFNITYSPQGEEAPPVSTPVPYPFRIGARSLSIRSGVLII